MSLARTIAGCSVLGWCALASAPSHAQTAAPAAPEVLPGVADEKARQTFREGVEAFDRRDFEAARVAFLQTYALKPGLPVVSRNLGLAEIYSGYYLDGARRLARVLHTTDDGTARDRSRMLESLKRAEVHLERLTVEVNVDGAAVRVDDVELGPSPLTFAWYVAPGTYDVHVEKPGYAPFVATHVARAGHAEHVRVVLEPLPPPGSELTAPAPAPLDVAASRGPEPWVLVSGGIGVAAGLAGGVTLSLLAADSADEVDRLGQELAGFRCPAAGVPQCREVKDAASRHDSQTLWAGVSFAAAGVIGAATLVYALVTSSAEPRASAGSDFAARLVSGLRVQPGERFVGWQGSF